MDMAASIRERNTACRWRNSRPAPAASWRSEPHAFRPDERSGAVGGAGEGADTDYRFACDQWTRGPDAPALSLPSSRSVQRKGEYGQRLKFHLSKAVTRLRTRGYPTAYASVNRRVQSSVPVSRRRVYSERMGNSRSKRVLDRCQPTHLSCPAPWRVQVAHARWIPDSRGD